MSLQMCLSKENPLQEKINLGFQLGLLMGLPKENALQDALGCDFVCPGANTQILRRTLRDIFLQTVSSQ
jgi:hypothetical protein